MHDAGGGGGGGGVGSYIGLIAAAAAKAELLHNGWDSTGDYSAKRSLQVDGSSSDAVEYNIRVEVNTITGDYTAVAEGPSAELHSDNWIEEATAALEKWPPKIEGLFTKWQDLPSRYASSSLLDVAAGELNIDPDNPQSTGDSFGDANDRLAGDLERIKSRTAELNGEYAEAFADYYANQIPTTISGQDMLLSALAVATRAQGEVWGRTSDDLSSFEYDAWKAMKSSGPSGGPDSGLVMALTVVAAFGTALAAVPTLGGSVALFGAISGAATIGAAVEAAKTADTSFEDLPLGANDPDAVFANMEDALRALDTEIEVQETGIKEFLVAAKTFADSGSCELTAPGLNAAPPGQVLDPQQQVTVDAHAIAQITELWLPSVAADLRKAESYLTVTSEDGFYRPSNVGLAPNGAWPEFSALQSRTSSLLLTLSGDLESAADKLEEAARIIGMTDEQTSQHLRNVENEVERRNLNDVDDVVPLL